MAPKVHTRINHDRALCGVNPNRGLHTVVNNTEFLVTPAARRCTRCAGLFRDHGYKIDLPAKVPQHKARHAATAASHREAA